MSARINGQDRTGISLLGVIALLLMPLLLTGCSDDMSELRAKVDRQIRKTDHNVPAPPRYEEFPKFQYVAAKLRDPFLPARMTLVNPKNRKASACKGPKPQPNRRRQPLEAYSLDSLRMVGTLEQKGTVWALIRTKNGTVHRVRPNHYLGQNHGRITSITGRKITIREIVENRDNQYNDGCPYRTRTAAIALSH